MKTIVLVNCQEGHKKYYIIEYFSDYQRDYYKVKAIWGRLGYKYGEQIKYEGSSEITASEVLERLKDSKLNKGYEIYQEMSEIREDPVTEVEAVLLKL